jgi:hypothetical protein
LAAVGLDTVATAQPAHRRGHRCARDNGLPKHLCSVAPPRSATPRRATAEARAATASTASIAASAASAASAVVVRRRAAGEEQDDRRHHDGQTRDDSGRASHLHLHSLRGDGTNPVSLAQIPLHLAVQDLIGDRLEGGADRPGGNPLEGGPGGVDLGLGGVAGLGEGG